MKMRKKSDQELEKIAVQQAKNGDFVDAIKTARRLRYFSDRAWVLADIVNIQIDNEDFDNALKTAEYIEDYKKDFALCRIAKAQAKNGDYDDAIKTAESIKIFDYKGLALYYIAKKRSIENE